MHLVVNRVPSFPRLAWVTRATSGDAVATVYAGMCVETASGWCAEGVWDTDFEAADFDLTSLIFGSGVRCRGRTAAFVSSGTMLERLWVYERNKTFFIGNSLPAVLAVSGARLSPLQGDYPVLTTNAMKKYRELRLQPTPVSEGQLFHVYFHNILWDGTQLRVVPKPHDAPPFGHFKEYRDYLYSKARSIGANASNSARRHAVNQLTTISSGYDSAASAVIAREAGCRVSATITHARSVIPRSDSGEPIAECLGLACRAYPRTRQDPSSELWFWAPLGTAQDINFSVLETPEPVCLLYTGVFGGEVWTTIKHMHPDNMKFSAINSVGIGEYRLSKGIIHCPVPFWGLHRVSDLWTLTWSDDMAAWRVGTNYDRPIPRRILEEVGVPRAMFGQKKSATQYEDSFQWPYSPKLQTSYSNYLRALGIRPPLVPVWRVWNALDRNIVLPLEERFNQRWLRRLRAKSTKSRFLFQWANHMLAEIYAGSLH